MTEENNIQQEAKTCPLCGGPNGCQADTDPNNCWCMSVSVPQALLDQVPAEQKGTACICQKCVENYRV